jgi:CheY-like chemotaxis protein
MRSVGRRRVLFTGVMPPRLHADRWGDLEVLAVTGLDLPADAHREGAIWWCGRCGDAHPLAAGAVVALRSHLGVSAQIACPGCADLARRRREGARPRRVLLVEDDDDQRDLTRRYLERDAVAEVVGYASDGREALTEIARLHPDVVLLDLAMPRLDGLDVLARLPDDVEVVVLSGRPEYRDRCQALHGDVTVVSKGTGCLPRLAEVVAGGRTPLSPGAPAPGRARR